MKKKLCILVLLLVMSTPGFAQQINISSLIVKPVLPANVSQWNATAVNGIATGTLGTDGVRMAININRNGNTFVCGTTYENAMEMEGFATKVIKTSDVIAAMGDCILPPGEYSLCVQFYRSGLPDAYQACRSFTVAGTSPSETGNISYTGPTLITPADGASFTPSQYNIPLTFHWTPVIPQPPIAELTYTFRVYEISHGQQAAQALLSNPVYEKACKVTQAMWKPPIQYAASSVSTSFVWTVQATNGEGQGYGPNSGKSAPYKFVLKSASTSIGTSGPTTTTGTTAVTPLPGNGGTNNTTSTVCTSVSTRAFQINDIIHLSDGFDMKLIAVPTGDNEHLTGTGTVLVKWLGLLNVQFKDIKVNSTDFLCAGAVYTVSDPNQAYPTQWAQNVLMNSSLGTWTIAKVKQATDYIKSHINIKQLVSATDQVNGALVVTPVNMPLGYFKNQDQENLLGFTEMVFRPDNAEFEVTASLNTDKIFKNDANVLAGTNALALHGEHILFTSAGLKGINGTIKLVQPITFNYNHTATEPLKLTFNIDGANHIGNAIVFDNSPGVTEFWNYKIDIDAQLPKEWLVPVDTTKTNVTMNFQLSIINWSDWVLQGILPACTIPNAKGLGVEVGSIVFDHSDIENSATMGFPAGYLGDQTVMFSGFYLKNFKLTLPDQLRSYASPTQTIQVFANDLIIDKDGLTGVIVVNNVLMYPLANVGNLGASIDNISVKINRSTLIEAKMLGQITLPMSNTDTVANAINYQVLFIPDITATPDPSLLTFSLLPVHDITSKFFGDGKVQIDQTSTLNLVMSKATGGERKIALNIDINGQLSYPMGKILDPMASAVGAPPLKMDLDLSCKFEHMGMTYSKNSLQSPKQHFTFSAGNWSFASPQKYLFGFPFTISAIHPFTEPIVANTEGDYLFKGGIEFVAKINIGNEKVGVTGDAKFKIIGAVISTEYGTTNVNSVSAVQHDWQFLTHIKAGFLKVEVSKVHVDFKTSMAEVTGNVELIKNDPIWGVAFKGDLTAKFTQLKLAVNAGAIFGNTKYKPTTSPQGTAFKYWMVQAQVNLPAPGIPFMTGLVFRGFGAGVYSRMSMTLPAVFDATVASQSTFGGANFTPDINVGFGFKAKAIIATTPKEEMLNGSVALQAQFSPGGTALQFIAFTGLFNCGAQIGQETKAFANGQLLAQNDFVNKTFDMNVLLNINKVPITTPGGINVILHIDAKQNKWFFQCGKQQAPNKLRLTLGTVIDFNSYLMFGNDIQKPTGFMPETIAGFNQIGYAVPSFIDNATSEGLYQSAKGFAFGIGVNGAMDGTQKIGGKNNYANVNWILSAGGEVDASLLQYTGCGGLGEGWRAKAQMAMYVGVSLGYSYNTVLGNGSGTLASIKGYAVAAAEFPKDIYFEGDAGGEIAILDLFTARFDQHFKYGNPCVGNAVVAPNAVYVQEDAAATLAAQASTTTLISRIMTPGSPTNIARDSKFSALLNYPYNEPFDLQEQQSSGQMKVRTFRVLYTQFVIRDSITAATPMNQPIPNNNVVTAPKQVTGTVQPAGNYQQVPGSRIRQGIAVNGTSQQLPNQNRTVSTRPILNTSVATTTLALQNINWNIELVPKGYDVLGAKTFILAGLDHAAVNQYNQNALKPNRSYKFEITGVLEELVGNTWTAVKRPGTNIPITQTKKNYFKTNSATVSLYAPVSSPAGQSPTRITPPTNQR